MAVAITSHLPGVKAEQYDQLIKQVGASLSVAPGFLSHSASAVPGGWQWVELWRSEEEWARFAEAKIAPLAQAAGLPMPQTKVEPLHRLVTPVVGNEGKPEGKRPSAVGQDEGEVLKLGPLEILVKEDGQGTRQMLAVAEFRGKKFRVPPHTHTEHDETIYVLEGEMHVMLGDQVFVAPAGTSFTIPVNVPHSIWNESGTLVRFLNNIAPARYLEYFHEMALASTSSFPPPAEIHRIMGRYGLVPVLPPSSV